MSKKPEFISDKGAILPGTYDSIQTEGNFTANGKIIAETIVIKGSVTFVEDVEAKNIAIYGK